MFSRLRPGARKQEGFTLIELIVVVAILGILAAVVTPRVLSALENAKNNSALAFGKQVQLAMERYYVDNAEYPDVDANKLSDPTDGLGAQLAAYLSIEATQLGVEEYTVSAGTGGVEDTYVLVINVSEDGDAERLVTIRPTGVELGDTSGS